MGCGNFFWGLHEAFLVAVWALLWFLYGGVWSVWFRFVVRVCMVCGAFHHDLWCGFMLVSVELGMLLKAAGRGREFPKKKELSPLCLLLLC